MTNQEFDDIIKNKAQQRDAEVLEDIWENIVEQKKKRRIPFFWWMFLCLLLAGTGVVWIISSHTGKSSTTQAEQNNIEIHQHTQQTAYLDKKDNSGVKDKTDVVTTILPKTNDSVTQMVTAAGKENSFEKIQPGIGTNNTNNLSKKLAQNAPRPKGKDVKKMGKSGWQQANDDYSKTGNKIISSKQRRTKDRGVFKIKSPDAETDLVSGIEKNKHIAGTQVIREEIEEEKTDLLPQKNSADSSSIKTTLSLLSDSSKKTKEPAVATFVKQKKSSSKKPGWKIEFAISQVLPVQQYRKPLQTTRSITQPGFISQFVSDNISTSIESGTGFSIGLLSSLDKKWSLGAGIQYLQFTELLEFSGVETNSDVTSIRKTKTIIDGRNVYYNLTVPVFVHYSFAKQRKWTAALRAGVYLDISRKYHNDIPGNFVNEYASGLPSSLSKNNIGADIFAGLHVSGPLSKRYEWFAEPAFRYNLSRYNSNALSFNKKIHKPTISIGVSYRLWR